jgi:hypothetical protein
MPVVSGSGGETSGEGFETVRFFFLVHGSRVRSLVHGVQAYFSKRKGSHKNDSLCSYIKCKASKFISLLAIRIPSTGKEQLHRHFSELCFFKFVKGLMPLIKQDELSVGPKAFQCVK